MDFLYPPMPERGAYRQITSEHRSDKPARGTYRQWSHKSVTLEPGVPHEVADIRGAGLITRLFVGVPPGLSRPFYRQTVVRCTWDDASTPCVEAPLGDFFGIHHARPRSYDSRLFSVLSGGITCHAPMPFSRRARVTFTQEGRLPVPLVFYGLGYYTLAPERVSPYRFHCSWRRQALTRRGEPFTFAAAAGSGFYVGLHLSTQNRELWPLSKPTHWLLPRGFGLGQLEGPEELYVDGERTSQHRGTGHEEYFNCGWYFTERHAAGLDSGCLHRSYLTGRTASYRYHWLDALPFRRSFRGIFHHGMNDRIAADYSATAYWYQQEPHGPQPPLSAAAQRAVLPHLTSRRYG